MFKNVAKKLIVIATLLGFVLLPLTGCIDDETSHTLYLESDGTVTWRTIQDLVRSDQDDPTARLDDEEEWADKAARLEEGWAPIMQELGASDIQQWFLRDSRPYTLITEATFDDLEDLVVRADTFCEQDNKTTLEHDGDLRTLTTTIVIPAEHWTSKDDDKGNVWILSALNTRIVATDGRFIEAEGFELSDDGTIATPQPLSSEDIARRPAQAVYSLTWDTTA